MGDETKIADAIWGNVATVTYTYNGTIGTWVTELASVGKPERKEGIMCIYKAYLVDTKELAVLSEATLIGKDEKDALMDFEMTDEQKKLRRRGRLIITLQEVGKFEKYAQKVEVEAKED